MSEINEINKRWTREHRRLITFFRFLSFLAVVLWPVSYFTSIPAATSGQGIWFAAVSTVTLVAAIGTTIGGAVMSGMVLTDYPPLEGSNSY